VRLSKEKKFANSKPCHSCVHLLNLFQVKWVVYTQGDGSVRRVRTRDLNNEEQYITTGYQSVVNNFGNVIEPKNFTMIYKNMTFIHSFVHCN